MDDPPIYRSGDLAGNSLKCMWFKKKSCLFKVPENNPNIATYTMLSLLTLNFCAIEQSTAIALSSAWGRKESVGLH